MRRPLYIKELAVQPFPLGLIGHQLLPFEEFLRTVCFADNERGDAAKATEAYYQKIVEPCNRLLLRNSKPLRLNSVSVEPSRHHTVCVRYQVRKGCLWVSDVVHVSLFLASKKAIAMERKADEEGEDYTIVAPRRGEKPPKKKPAARRKQQARTRRSTWL